MHLKFLLLYINLAKEKMLIIMVDNYEFAKPCLASYFIKKKKKKLLSLIVIHIDCLGIIDLFVWHLPGYCCRTS